MATLTRLLSPIPLALLAACGGAGPVAGPPASTGADTTFGPAREVTIRGYDGDAMEPFITPDARYLLFNDSNDPAADTQLHAAEAVDDTTFDYAGPLTPANSPALDAVPSVDGDGRLYFISTRDYAATRATVYTATFAGGRASAPRLVAGLGTAAGELVFDVDVSRDGTTMVYATGRFRGGAVPEEADLSVALRRGERFERSAEESARLAALNTAGALEYAVAMSEDGREMLFTRFRPGGEPQILRATRASPAEPFGAPARVVSASGFVEAPALTPDGRGVYYHARVDGRFRLFRIDRRFAR